MSKFYFMILSLLFALNLEANMSPFFIQISDALGAAKSGDSKLAKDIMVEFQEQFNALNIDTALSNDVKQRLKAVLNDTSVENIESLSSALIAFEKEQNPVDYEAKRAKFKQKVMSLYKQLVNATKDRDLEQIPSIFKRFYDSWQRNERVVGDLSPWHYGKIETSMALYRMAMVSTPSDIAAMDSQIIELGEFLNDFLAGNTKEIKVDGDTLEELKRNLTLLDEAKDLIGIDNAKAKSNILNFITNWPLFEGEIRTRSANLYNAIESDLPQIAADIDSLKSINMLNNIIDNINSLDFNANYNAYDVAIVLIREGVEALLIVVALLAAVKTGNLQRAKAHILGGAGIAIVASVFGAATLSYLFPLAAAGTNREILEGIVGILAVVVMVFVVAWLHSKSSLKAWNAYITKQINRAVASGSLLWFGLLSFLAVFREGAETILFYAGMLPKVQISSFISGIVAALAILILIAYFMKFITSKIAMHNIFKLMSLLLYALGFKILGVSVHALQLTNILPNSIISSIPSISFIGFYNTLEGLIMQIAYISSVIILALLMRKKAV
ncbi:FTR1 family protein [Campylobacter sp. CX2-4080-23]|uniref:FTR1 family iron permease n=1 Tax=Campylobacter porcelli TaxID=1660073 RepID=UPI002EC65D64|nr:FTR1 family protein [Campylobacter sp. CX2-4080-23]